MVVASRLSLADFYYTRGQPKLNLKGKDCKRGMEMPPRPHTVGGPMPRAHIQSECIVQLLQEIENEARGPVAKPKPPPKNHMKENLKRLKDIEAQAKCKMAEKQPLRVPNKYSEAQSKISIPDKALPNLHPPRTAGPTRSQPSLTPDRRPSIQACKSLPQLNQVENEQVFDVPPPPRDLESSRSDSRSDVSAPSMACSKKKSKFEIRHRPGQIPNYLLERKRQWEVEREQEQRTREEAAVPRGYTLLPDEERAETLQLLKKNREELIQSLSSLPVRNDTMRLRSCKEELERQLAKVEEGIKIFSRPKVLIKHDT